MKSITLRLNEEENKLIRDYAKTNSITISELFRQAVLEKIEEEIDLEIYNKAMIEYQNDPQDISFGQMMEELDIND